MHEPDHQDYLAPFAPSVFAKSQPIRKTVGRGGGDRTRSPIEFGNDLLLASRNSDVASALLENDLALSSSIRRPLPSRRVSKCMCSNEIHRLGRGIQTHEPRYFDDLTAPIDKFNGDKTTNRIPNGK